MTIYNYDDALKMSIEYFGGEEISAKVFLDKYALKDSNNVLLEATPEQMFHRISSELHRIEKKKYKNPLSFEEILEYLRDFKRIIPQGSPMSGIGNPYQFVTISNCYVVPSPLDSYGGICREDEHVVQISKRRGGVGTDISNLRPNGSSTTNAARSSTGIIPFMERFSNSIREVGQSGRRGALMLTLSIHHPEVLDFAKVKRNLNKVTGANLSIRLSDEFLKAVKDGKKYEQRFPVDAEPGKGKVSQMVDAREVWMKIIENAHATAEPGLLFWDRIISESPADCYSAFGYATTSTNPCICGDTLVYVADGRGHVSIKQLAKEGKDISVFCYDQKGKIAIRTMRNPRVTGYKEKIYKLILEDGCEVKATGNHKFRLGNGEYKQLKEIVPGDSIKTLTKYESSLKDIFPKCNSNSQDYLWISDGFSKNIAEHRLIASHFYREIKKGEIVHHIDYDAKNNSPMNLKIITKKDHDKFHSIDMIGDKNPMRRAKTEWSEEKWEEYRKKHSENNRGNRNANFSGISHEEIKKHAIELTLKLGRRFSKKEWIGYAKEKNIVVAFSKWRKKNIGSILELSRKAALECDFKNIDEDPRLLRTLQKAFHQGYVAKIEGNQVLVRKKCEYCDNYFYVNYFRREIGFCSRSCSNLYLNTQGVNKKRTSTINETYLKKSIETKNKQLDIFTSLKYKIEKEPLLKEWEDECKKNNIPHRLRTKYGFDNFKELKESSLVYNHRVIAVEECGYEDVYNGTVDDFHNFFVGGFGKKTKNNKNKFLYVNNLQCGELPLCPYDSCRLLLLNLFGYVKEPFTKDAYFDFESFTADSKIAQRFMDDLIDIELEMIDRIIKKIKDDPESIEIKRNELELWTNMKRACGRARRTGTGITALGDTLAALGVEYGSVKSIKVTEDIYRTLKLACYRSSVEMAKEIGAFEIWDPKLEAENPFLLRIKEEDSELYADMNKYGRRNIACLTTAPAGSVSILTQTTSGIEPLFQISYKRRKKINVNDGDMRVDFIDPKGDKWQEFEIYHPKVKMWMDITGETDITKSPWHGCCADDLNWLNRVKMQAAANRHVDHSISSTLNLPEDVTVEEVAKIYEAAWKEGCKGLTVYRKNCRTGVLVDNTAEEKKLKIKKTQAPKRPKILSADIYHTVSKGELYFVIVGLLGDDPYEVFAGKNGEIKKSVKNGMIQKLSRGKYSLLAENGEILQDDISKHIDEDQEAITRLISSNLRHGCDVSFVVHQLEKVKGDLLSYSKAISRVLKKYIPENQRVHGESCKECGAELVRVEGCLTCRSCGWSRC